MLFSKPSPSTPAKSRPTYDPSIDSPIVCPSLTGAEENSSFASPPVPALQRKLLRMSMQGKGPSGLRTELQFDEFEDGSTILGSDSIEYLTEDHFPGGHREGSSSWEDLGPTSLESIVFNRKPRNSSPVFDPDVSLGDVSMIEGIYDDAARAGAYLDSQQTGNTDVTPNVLSEINGDDHDSEDLILSSTTQTESGAESTEAAGIEPAKAPSSMIDASIQTEIATEVTSDEPASTMVDATVQTETETMVTNDVGVQVYQPGKPKPKLRISADVFSCIDEGCRHADHTGGSDRSVSSHQSVPFDKPISLTDSIVQDLSARVRQLEGLIGLQSRSSSSIEHEALVDAYRGLLRVEAEKRLDLAAMISSFKEDLASCKKQQSDESVSQVQHSISLSYAK